MSVEDAVARIRARVAQRVQSRLELVRDTATELHDNAPRGGSSINALGQPRSAPGEQPAIEFGDLRQALQTELQFDESQLMGSTVVNWAKLEYGEPPVLPRPMGRMTVDAVKQQVASER